MKVRIDSIVVGERARKDTGEMDSLERSMSKLGQLQPIGITHDNVLVFGERRLRAAKHIGWTEIEARIIDCDALLAEHDENVIRKQFTVTEQIALAQVIQGQVAGRAGGNRMPEHSGNISGKVDQGDSRDIAARAAGLGSGKTLEAAQRVIERGTPELIEAMDRREISIHGADKLARQPADKQREAVAGKRAKSAGKPTAADSRPEQPQRKQRERPDAAPAPDKAPVHRLSFSYTTPKEGAETLLRLLESRAPDVLAEMRVLIAA